MRIALVTPNATPPDLSALGGRGPDLIPLAQAVAGNGHDVRVYARKDAPALSGARRVSSRVRIEHVPAGPSRWLPPDDLVPHVRQFGDFLAKRWREERPDVVHAYSWPCGLAAFAAARELDVPIVQTFHSLAGPAGKYQLWQPREPMARLKLKVSLARNVQAVLARSSEEMRRLVSLGVPRTAVKIVPWGVDTGHFGPEGPVEQRDGRPRLLAFLPYAGEPGMETLLRALVDLPGVELVLAGGPGQTSPQRAPRSGKTAGQPSGKLPREITRLINKFKLADRVTVRDNVRWDDLPALLRSADLMVATHDDGVCDESALQAMACGTPVVAPAEGFYPDAVIDGTTGMLIPGQRPAGLALRVRQLLSSSLQREAFGIAAADRARSRYSWDRIGRETARVYERCAAPLSLAELAGDVMVEPGYEEAEVMEAAG